MAKIAILADTHYGARQDSIHFHDIFAEFFRDIFFPKCKEAGIKHVLHLGDLADRRRFINVNTLRRMQNDFLKPLKKSGMKMDLIVGNHDTYYKDTNELNLPSLLLAHEKNINVIPEAREIEREGVRFACLPWICKSNREASMAFLGASTASIALGHVELKGFRIFGSDISSRGMESSTFSKFDKTFLGHYHTRSYQNNIHYLGTPYQLTWIDHGDMKGFHIYDTDTGKLEFISNPVNNFIEVGYDDADYTSAKAFDEMDFSKLERKYVKLYVTLESSKMALFDNFMDRVNDANPIQVRVIDIPLAMNRKDTAAKLEDGEISIDDTKSIIRQSVHGDGVELSSDNDKQALADVLIGLYTKAGGA